MVKTRFLNVLVVAIIACAFCLSLSLTASAQFLPASYYYTQPLYYPSYAYSNTIDGFLLGFNTYSPFLAPSVASAYTTAGINVYPYLSNPFSTAFPYATLDVLNPYAPVAYPTFTYGDPSLYAYWVNLNL